MITHRWLSSVKMTIYVRTDSGTVVHAAPIARKFIGQPYGNLIRWMQKQGGFKEAILPIQKEPEVTGQQSGTLKPGDPFPLFAELVQPIPTFAEIWLPGTIVEIVSVHIRVNGRLVQGLNDLSKLVYCEPPDDGWTTANIDFNRPAPGKELITPWRNVRLPGDLPSGNMDDHREYAEKLKRGQQQREDESRARQKKIDDELQLHTSKDGSADIGSKGLFDELPEAAPVAVHTLRAAEEPELVRKARSQAPKGALLLMKSGDFYEAFGDDAKAAASILGLTITSMKRPNHEELPMTGFMVHQLDGYLQKLVKHGRQVAICESAVKPSVRVLNPEQPAQPPTQAAPAKSYSLDDLDI